MKTLLQHQSRLFYKILILCVLLVSVVTLTISSILYILYEQDTVSQNAGFIQDSLEKVSNSAVFMSDWAQTVAIQTLYDNDIIRMMSYDTVEPQNVVRFRNRITSIRQSSPNIVSIYIYNGKTQKIYSDINNSFEYSRETFFDTNIFQYLDEDTTRYHLKPIPRQMEYTVNGNLDIAIEVYTFILYENPNIRRPADNAIVINVARKWLDNAIQTMDNNKVNNLIVINGQGQVVYSAGAFHMMTDLSGDTDIEEVMRNGQTHGYFITGKGSGRQLTTFVRGTGKESDWIYIYRLPAANLTEDIKRTQQTTVLFSALMFLLGVLGSLFYAVYVYRPIHLLQNKLSWLETEKLGRQHELQQAFLRSALNENTMDLTELDAAMAAHDLPAVARKPVSLALFILDNYRQFDLPNAQMKRDAIHSTMFGVPGRKASAHGEAFIVDMGAGLFALALCRNDDEKTDMETLAVEIQAELNEVPGLSCSAVYGASSSNWYKLSESWTVLRSALSQRVFLGYGCVINAASLTTASTGYEYPAHEERQLCQLLLMKQADQALLVCREIFNAISGYSGNLLQITVLRVTSAVMEMADKLNGETGVLISYDFESLIARVGRAETLDEILAEYERLFRTVIDQISTGRTQNHKELIDGIVEAIHAQYADSALTIDSFESITKLSGRHLARLFNKFMGETFSDYLRRYRLEKARALISSTQEPVQHIAVKVGFSNSNHFFTLFKKEYGLTPAEYRQRRIKE